MHSEKKNEEEGEEEEEDVNDENFPLITKNESSDRRKYEILNFDFFITVESGIMDIRCVVFGSNEIIESDKKIERRIRQENDTSPQEYSMDEQRYVKVILDERKFYLARIDYRLDSEEENYLQNLCEENGTVIHSHCEKIGETHLIYMNNSKKDVAILPKSLKIKTSPKKKKKKKKENNRKEWKILKKLGVVFNLSSIAVCCGSTFCYILYCGFFFFFVIVFSATIPVSGWRIVTLFFTGFCAVCCTIPFYFICNSILMDFIDEILRLHQQQNPKSIRDIILNLINFAKNPKELVPDESIPLDTLDKNKRYFSRPFALGIGIILRVIGIGCVCVTLNIWNIVILIGYLLVFREIKSSAVQVIFGVLLPTLCIFFLACFLFVPLFGYFIELHYSTDDDEDEDEKEVKLISDKDSEEFKRKDFEQI